MGCRTCSTPHGAESAPSRREFGGGARDTASAPPRRQLLQTLWRCSRRESRMTEPALQALAPTADRVFLNGKVITVNARDEVAEALAVAGDRILRVGSRAYVEQTIGRDTQVVDLRGRALIPGLYENHIHMTNSFQRHWLDCTYEATA